MKTPLKTEWQRRWLALETTCQAVQDVADEIELFSKKAAMNKQGVRRLVLCGPPGNGKTKIASGVYDYMKAVAFSAFEKKYWYNRPVVTEWVDWPVMVDSFKAGHYERLTDLFDADFLAIDDIGAENDPSKNGADKLCQILSRNADKYSILTTNVHPDEWESKLDARIADRFLRNSQIIVTDKIPSYSVWSITGRKNL